MVVAAFSSALIRVSGWQLDIDLVALGPLLGTESPTHPRFGLDHEADVITLPPACEGQSAEVAYFPTRGLQKFHPVGIRAARQNHNRSFAPPRSEWLVRIGQGDPLSSALSESAISSARA